MYSSSAASFAASSSQPSWSSRSSARPGIAEAEVDGRLSLGVLLAAPVRHLDRERVATVGCTSLGRCGPGRGRRGRSRSGGTARSECPRGGILPASARREQSSRVDQLPRVASFTTPPGPSGARSLVVGVEPGGPSRRRATARCSPRSRRWDGTTLASACRRFPFTERCSAESSAISPFTRLRRRLGWEPHSRRGRWELHGRGERGDVLLRGVAERPDHDVPAVVGAELRRHGLQRARVERPEQQGLDEVVAVVAEGDFRAADLDGGAVEDAARASASRPSRSSSPPGRAAGPPSRCPGT